MDKANLKKEVRGLSWAFLIAMIIRTFIYQPFNIPSGSMIPTLLIGDYLFVNKFCYGYSRHSLPFGVKLFSGRLMHNEPLRGDVVVFFNPKHDNLDYIKRLVGLPGDRIQAIKGVLHINGSAVKLEQIEDYHTVNDKGQLEVIPQYIETLPNGVKHPILKKFPFGQGRLDNTEEFTVPEGHYFMMGDNRDNSQDSRVPNAVGYVPAENIIGRAEVLFFSTEAKWYAPLDWPFGLRYNRLAQLIR
ncbi:signal peptidase I [Candidatus Finniella inopinata]|uniref:Signal peptidase I n=2 Tax=Candidatus Finniella inopinata TaxID=1696036 RepID=A0A4Q7DKS6_9PROT|nr:signal peptidase I [Candidatus Finniella inopinata]